MIDAGLGFVLLLACAVAQLRPRDAAGALWTCLLIVVASGAVFHWNDLAPLWLAAGLIVAMYSTVGLARGAIPTALVAGAACALRAELAPCALVFLAAAWWRNESWRDRRRLLPALAAAFVIGWVPYALARAAAWATVDDAARRLLDPARASLVGRIGLFVIIALALVPLMMIVIRELADWRLRWLAGASAAGLAAIASQAFGSRPYSTHYIWPIAVAGVVVIVVDIAARRELSRIALTVALLGCVLVQQARVARGRLEWGARYVQLAHNIGYLRSAPTEPSSYDRILAAVPDGDTVAVWVTRPETLDYTRHRIFDLRTPRAVKLRVNGAEDRRLEQLVRAVHAHWMVIEADDAFEQRANESLLYRLLCSRAYVTCADSLEAIAFRHRVVLERDGVKLIAIE